MASDHNTSMVSGVKDLFTDLSDLVKKEIRLASAEIKGTISSGLQAGIWMAAGGVVGLIAVLVLIQAIIFGLAELGLGLFWSSLIVGVVLAVIAAIAFFRGRSLASNAKGPQRTIRNVNQDITAVREQFS